MADFKKIAKISVHALLGVASFATIVFLPQISGLLNQVFKRVGDALDNNNDITGFIANLCSEIFSESVDEIVVDNIKDLCEELIDDSEIKNCTLKTIKESTSEEFRNKYFIIIAETVDAQIKTNNKIERADVKKITNTFIDYQKQLKVKKDVLEKSATYKALSDDEKELYTKVYKKCRASWLNKMFLNKVDREAQIFTNIIINTIVDVQDENRKYIETLFAQYLGGNGGKFNLSQIQTTKFEYGFYLQQCPHCGYDGEYIYPTNADKSEYFCCACGKKYEVIRGIKDKDEIIKAIEKVGDGLKSHIIDKFADQANQIKSVDEKINQLATEKVIKELMDNVKIDTKAAVEKVSSKVINDLNGQIDTLANSIDSSINDNIQKIDAFSIKLDNYLEQEKKINLAISAQIYGVEKIILNKFGVVRDEQNKLQSSVDNIEKILLDTYKNILDKVDTSNEPKELSEKVDGLKDIVKKVFEQTIVVDDDDAIRICPICNAEITEKHDHIKDIRCQRCNVRIPYIDLNSRGVRKYYTEQEIKTKKENIQKLIERHVAVAKKTGKKGIYEINLKDKDSNLIVVFYYNEGEDTSKYALCNPKMIRFIGGIRPSKVLFPNIRSGYKITSHSDNLYNVEIEGE